MEDLFASPSLAACVFDREQRIRSASEAAAAIFGLPTLAGLLARDLVPGAGPVLSRCFDLAQLGAALPETRFMAGERHYTVTFHGTPDSDTLLAVAMDMTRSLRIEQVLRTSRRRLLTASRSDHLTSLLNRRGLDAALHRELRRARRAAAPLSLLLIDIDWFKAYNDSLGHQEGDRCLALVAGALGGCLRRASDLACRYGGEEFVLILPETDAPGAAAVAANCQREIERLAVTHPASPLGRITASIGIVSVDAASSPADAAALITTADAALYRAKREGRNRCEFSEAVSSV